MACFSLKDGTAQRVSFGLAVLSTATQIALAAILSRLASLINATSPIFDATIAAVIFDFVVLLILIGIVGFALVARSSTSRTLQLSLSAASFILFVTASILSIYVLGWTWVNIEPNNSNSESASLQGITLAGFVIWTINMVAQTALHIFRSLRKRDQPDHIQNEVAEQQSTPRPVKRSLSFPLKSLSPNSSPFSRTTFEPSSPDLSSNPHSPALQSSTIRHSIQQVIRPITSRTKLMLNHGPTPRESGSFVSPRENNSLEISCRGDGFESWDTSSVEQEFVNPFVTRPMIGKKTLEPIPGSRPVSPAKPLDGPFPDYEIAAFPEKLPLPDSPMQSPVLLTSDADSMHSLQVPPPLRRASSSQESHIHPLFRSHSPTPPPTPSAGTVVTASPLAGQVVHGDYAMAPKRMQSRSDSRPTSPHTVTAVRTGSFPSTTRRPSNLSVRHPLDLEPEEVPEMPKM
ncbi:hypothetical protein Q7P37_011039 [Cladosporium fusiforme]